jgi:hypothetical protein
MKEIRHHIKSGMASYLAVDKLMVLSQANDVRILGSPSVNNRSTSCSQLSTLLVTLKEVPDEVKH